jgi:exonuclease SbcC
MDYEAFIRSVLLPQGEFQEFLAGDRDQRRKVLDGLLQLGVYSRMGQLANAMANRNTEKADDIARRLESELADATPDALKGATAELKSLEAEETETATVRTALEAAGRTAEALTTALDKQRSATERKTAAEKRLTAAQEATRTGDEKAAKLKASIEDLQTKVGKNTYDEAEFLRYRDANNHAKELATDEMALAEVEKQGSGLEAQVKTATEAIEKVKKAHEAAVTAAEAAAATLEEARRTNAAEALRQTIKPGDPCPVCGQTTHEVPHEKVPKLDQVREAEAKARKTEELARRDVESADRELTRIKGRQETFADSLMAAAKRVEDRRAALLKALDGKQATPKEIADELKHLEAAKAERDKLTRELDAHQKALAELTESMAKATAEQSDLKAQITAADREAAEAAAAAEESAQKLREAATKSKWPDIIDALDSGRDGARLLQSRVTEAQSRERDLNQAVGAQRTRIEVIEKNIEKAKGLQTEEKSLREESRLAKDLASLLRADAFPTFIRESALKRLATVGSEKLLEISRGRYDFVVDGQDFLVEDRWNGGEQRSVKTLSGGETFLASLALALALAEQLPGLAGESAAGALESLFIDEGFSHLDNETLTDVAEALEVLGQDRSRLIGVITHVPALAERMPSRITVHKTQTGSSVTVE